MSAKNHLVHGGHLTHFGHANIIKYTKRPFKHVDEMDGHMLKQINNTVQPNDILYHLGDFAFGHHRADNESAIAKYRSQIKCNNIHLILGNHDPHQKNGDPEKSLFRYFTSVHKMLPVRIQEPIPQYIVLCHYAMRVWNRSHHGAWHLYGHSHGSLPDDPNALSIDVGVDCFDFTPISVEQIAKVMSRKTFRPIDHHGAKE